MLFCSRSVGQGAIGSLWRTGASGLLRAKVPLVLSKHRMIRRVQDETGRRDRFTPRGSVPVILLGRLKGSLFRFLDFPLQSMIGEVKVGPLLVDGHLRQIVCRPEGRRHDLPAFPNQVYTQQTCAGVQSSYTGLRRTGTGYPEGTAHAASYNQWANWKGTPKHLSSSDAILRWGDNLQDYPRR